MYPKAIQQLIEDFKSLPGVGEKTAERYALSMLNNDELVVTNFARHLATLKENVKTCKICGNLSDNDVCDVCVNPTRDVTTICVVQEPKDIFAMEKTGYKGVYHVLRGVISASKGILPEDINVDSLITRSKDENVKEVIVATNPTLDGETTALFLSKVMKRDGLTITRLASGLPMGANLDYADELTLIRALEGRIKQ